jgi:hypothetical protein
MGSITYISIGFTGFTGYFGFHLVHPVHPVKKGISFLVPNACFHAKQRACPPKPLAKAGPRRIQTGFTKLTGFSGFHLVDLVHPVKNAFYIRQQPPLEHPRALVVIGIIDILFHISLRMRQADQMQRGAY